MTTSHRISGLCGVILAAGKSSRMGSQKPLLPWPPTVPGDPFSNSTLLSAAIAALYPFTIETIVVAGRNARALAPVVAAGEAILVENPHPEQGQFSSMRIGLQEVIARGFSAAMMRPVDSPPLSNASLQKLATAFRDIDGTDRIGVAPRNGDKRGHPLFATRELIDAFLSSPADSNAKMIKRAHEDRIEYVQIDDPFVGLNINTPDDYEALCRSVL
jgi:molybdenum cofactor cytidylyltransferase